MKGMVAEKLLPYPCLMWEEGTGEERVFIYPCREREEGTEELCTASLFSGLSDPAGFLHLCKAKIIMQNKNNLPEKRR